MKLPKHLILSGGGINGIQTLKAIHIIEQKINGTLYDKCKLESISTTSIGSFIGLGILLNYSSKEYLDNAIPRVCNYFDLFDKINISNIFNSFGLTNNDIFTTIVDKNIVPYKLSTYENKSISFEELFNITNIQFDIYVTNLSKSKIEVWNHITQPDMPVSFAVKVTTCLPFIFEPVYFNSDIYVDGSVIDNFPHNINLDYNYTLTIALVSKIEDFKITSFFHYLNRIFSIIINKSKGANHLTPQNTLFIQKSLHVFDMNIGYNCLVDIFNHTNISFGQLDFFHVKE